ncbi:WASP homolog-associated protein with actin, membranes and microtubules [Dipodomys spectabilis]|uniref:WASP homolog-associated protein with actin, membranes and microtubules n=1 Tax=Dipodomys spectabilis TaxID=105255 RepID=UPI001C54650E|nr:WASP homolog-associated protein with actin, membranes and microtubules [Dipodomys spectabilis]
MQDEQPDSLEGWVPVREGLFAAPEPHRLRFLVAWNDAEGQFAVTCHDRTAQRRQGEAGGRGPGPGPGAAAPPPSWAGLLSAAGLRGAHRQLAALWPPLERCFPRLPPGLDAAGGGPGRGLWARVWPARAGPGEAALRELCGQLERYLGEAAGGCGGATVRDALFPAAAGAAGAADCESPREFRERALRARRAEAGARLRQVLQGHGRASTLVALMRVYQEEEEAYQELVTVATMFFQHLLQPFRDMREVATLCRLNILKSLDEDDLGPKRVMALQKEAEEWTRQAQEAVASIQDITVDYFKETVKALAEMQRQMEQDEKRFGPAAWATATPRLERLKRLLARETLQLLRARELCLNHKKAEIKRKMEDLPDQEKNVDAVDELEMQYYEIQLELYEIKFEILKNEEILLIIQLDSIKRLIKEKQDEVVYYDSCESAEELQVVVDAGELAELNRQRQQLEAKRGRICTKRARLRSRQGQCKETHRLRLQQAEASIRHLHQHHSIQMKRDKVKEEEQKKKEWINLERQKTLQRLRAYKGKCPAQSVLKTCPEAMTGTLQPPSADPQWVSRTPGAGGGPPVPQGRGEKTPQHQDCSGTIPVQTHPKPSEELSLSAPPPPLPSPPPPPPPPPLPPALASASQAVTHQNSALRAPLTDDQPRSLLCELAERPRGCAGSFQGPGSMDEVLASLRQERTPLRKAEGPAVPEGPPPHSSANEQILAAIRQGVRLKKVHSDSGPRLGPNRKPASDLERSIKAALQRINRASADSEDSDEQSPGEWDR